MRSEDSFLVILEVLGGGRGHHFLIPNEDLDAAIATCSFKMFLALGLDDFLMILECPRT